MDRFFGDELPSGPILDNYPCSRVLIDFDWGHQSRVNRAMCVNKHVREMNEPSVGIMPAVTDLNPVLDALANSIQKFVEQAVQKPMPLAVDIVEAARLLGVCDDTIRKEVDRGELKASRVGRVWRIRVSELDAYLKRCETRQ